MSFFDLDEAVERQISKTNVMAWVCIDLRDVRVKRIKANGVIKTLSTFLIS